MCKLARLARALSGRRPLKTARWQLTKILPPCVYSYIRKSCSKCRKTKLLVYTFIHTFTGGMLSFDQYKKITYQAKLYTLHL